MGARKKYTETIQGNEFPMVVNGVLSSVSRSSKAQSKAGIPLELLSNPSSSSILCVGKPQTSNGHTPADGLGFVFAAGSRWCR